MRHLAASLSALILLPLSVFPQQDSLVDVFPLAVGNQWTYEVNSSDDDYLSDIYSGVRGRARCVIIGNVISSDSTRWFCREYDSLNVCYFNYFDPEHVYCSDKFDTMAFELIELHQGQHRIYRQSNQDQLWSSVWPFAFDLSDTAFIYRFVRAIPADTFIYGDLGKQSSCYVIDLSFLKGIGEIGVHCSFRCTGASRRTDHQLVGVVITSAQEPSLNDLPHTYSLLQNYPNPFNPSTTIQYSLPAESDVSLKIFDLLGRDIETIVAGRQEAGAHRVAVTNRGLSSGIYLYQLRARGASASSPRYFQATRKLIVLK